MMPFHRTHAVVSVAVALVVTGLAACRDEPTGPGESGLPAEIQALPPGIHPILSIPGLGVATGEEVTRIRLHLYEVATGDPVAGYQGVLRYDPEVLEVLDGSFADGIIGAWNVVEPGRLRFAGVALEGVREVPVIELTVKAHRRPAARDFSVEVEELTSAAGFADLTGQVSRGSAPLVTGVRIGSEKR